MAEARHAPERQGSHKPRAGVVGADLPAGPGLEASIVTTHARGLRINNLFEIGSGWRANLTDGRLFYEFGEGATPAAALGAALDRAAKARRP